jgi:SAM-dependent methyltransferase
LVLRWIDRSLSALPPWRRLRQSPAFRALLGFEETLWNRKMADEAVRRLVEPLGPETLDVLEISGEVWRTHPFRSYRNTSYPAFDLEAAVLDADFDLVIAEHVFEHLAWPRLAALNVLRMLRPGGHFLIVTPFLYKVHPVPIDCTRWTETGLRFFLADAGFPLETIITGSWGNLAVVEASFRREFRLFNRHVQSVESEPEFPIVVWALARAPIGADAAVLRPTAG